MARLSGKVAVVTGAARGIGHAVVEAFHAEGMAAVWAVDRDGDALEKWEAPTSVRPVALDVTDPAGVATWAKDVGTIDVLVNCAGVVHHGSVLDCSLEEWGEAMATNVTSVYLLTKAFLPSMVGEGRGSIVNIASVVSSMSGVPSRAAYGASKGAVIGLTKSIAADFVGDGVRCNAIAPGTIDTPSFRARASVGGDPEATMAEFVARQPMGRVGTPEEVASLAVHLASDESAFTTGAVYVADGGMTL